MKISKLIEELNKIEKEYGDLEVYHHNGEFFDTVEYLKIWFYKNNACDNEFNNDPRNKNDNKMINIS